MKISIIKLKSGRIIVLGDTGQSDIENRDENKEIANNICNSKGPLTDTIIGCYSTNIDI
jgi:hypothetical protein